MRVTGWPEEPLEPEPELCEPLVRVATGVEPCELPELDPDVECDPLVRVATGVLPDETLPPEETACEPLVRVATALEPETPPVLP